MKTILFTLSPIIGMVYATPIINSIAANTTSMELRGTILSYGDGNCNGGFGKRVYGEKSLCVNIGGSRSIKILDCVTEVTYFSDRDCRGRSEVVGINGGSCSNVNLPFGVSSANVRCV